MAEENLDAKTEAPSPRRREKAREQGQVAVSQDLTSGVLLLAGVLALSVFGYGIVAGLRAAVREDFSVIRHTDWELPDGGLRPWADRLLTREAARAGEILAWLLGAVVVTSLAAGVLQVGFAPTLEPLAPKWDRLSPARGLQKIFSLGALVRVGIALLKLAAVAALALWVIWGAAGEVTAALVRPLADAVGRGWDLAVRLALTLAAALTAIGVIDYLYQWWRHEQSLRMTRQEKRDELKEEEGDPHVKARLRRLQRDAAHNRMFQDVRQATLVVTNPTHLAVALRYDRGSMAAPRVVAKGRGKVAERLIALARGSSVPVVERKPLARALYKAVKVGQEIPAALYHAVAEVIAYVYRLRGAR